MTNKGGRGKKSLYKTTHTRIPENIKPIVDSLSSSYKEYVEESGCLDFDDRNLLTILENSLANSLRPRLNLGSELKPDKTEPIDRQKIIGLAQEAFAAKSNAGERIKELFAEVLVELDIPVTKSWIIDDSLAKR